MGEATISCSVNSVFSGAILPLAALGIIPAAVLVLSRTWHPGWGLGFPWVLVPVLAGSLLAVAGAALAVSTSVLFFRQGNGTPAPWLPPAKLVVLGPYRYVRNPMLSGALFVTLAEALLCGSWPLLAWFGVFLAGNLIYMPLFEEPALVRRFGEEYVEYRMNVPAWIPRLRPWTPARDRVTREPS